MAEDFIPSVHVELKVSRDADPTALHTIKTACLDYHGETPVVLRFENSRKLELGPEWHVRPVPALLGRLQEFGDVALVTRRVEHRGR